MTQLGDPLDTLLPQKAGGSLFGNRVLEVGVYQKGVLLGRKKGPEVYPFEQIEKITAQNYASEHPLYILVGLLPKKAAKSIEFALSPNRKDVNLLLSAFCDHLLGPRFPANLLELQLELGGEKSPVWLREGMLICGGKSVPVSDFERFDENERGGYDLRLRGVAESIPLSPDKAPNILATIKVLSMLEEVARRRKSREMGGEAQ